MKNEKKLETVQEESLKAVSGGAAPVGANVAQLPGLRAPAPLNLGALKGGFTIAHW